MALSSPEINHYHWCLLSNEPADDITCIRCELHVWVTFSSLIINSPQCCVYQGDFFDVHGVFYYIFDFQRIRIGFSFNQYINIKM
jgi:hypothetical protein